MHVEENVSMGPFTTFKIGGAARFFTVANTVEDIKEGVQFAKSRKLPFFVLGDGSNLLVGDKGFNGLVIKNQLKGIKIKEEASNFILVAAAGENWDDFVGFTVAQKLYGLENLSYIPGTVGAAPVQNIGAYGAEIKDSIMEVEVFDSGDGRIKVLSPKQCKFGYRESIFKKPIGRKYIITKVTFLLSKSGKVNIGYKDLREKFKDRYSQDVSIEEVRNAVIEIRKKKLPDWRVTKTAGSFFKNPFISLAHFEKLKEKYPDLPGFREKNKIKIPLAWILDVICDLKGFKIGNVGLYEKQPLAVVNFDGATANEMEKFAGIISQKITEKTGIHVEWEVRVLK